MEHNREIVDQFTRQARQFADSPAARNEEILDFILTVSQPHSGDLALDVACGPGVLACAMAKRVKHVTGIDLTPAMLDQARHTQRAQNIANVTWVQGDGTALPSDDAAFDIVTCRFAFHHFSDPFAVLREMRRVCRPGARIVVADSAPAAAKADAFNAMERLRDPSHARAMPVEELTAMFRTAGLPYPHIRQTRLALELDSLLSRSYPRAGDEARIRALFDAALIEDHLDVKPRREHGKIHLSFPVAILSAQVPHAS